MDTEVWHDSHFSWNVFFRRETMPAAEPERPPGLLLPLRQLSSQFSTALSGSSNINSGAFNRSHHKPDLQSFVSFRDGEKPGKKASSIRLCIESVFHRWSVPILHWLPRYNWRKDLFWDFNAGLVVGILLIPQGMAYALLANQSPIHGLYCAIIPNIVYAILGTSRESAVGAMALVSIMVGNAVTMLTIDREDAHSRLDVALKLGFLTGLFQVLMGSLRLGTIATYVSHPVMVGFCTAGEILIAISQLKYLLGIKVPQFVYAFQTLEYIFRHLDETRPYTVLMGMLSFTFLFLLSKWKRRQREVAEKNPELGRNPRLRFLRITANFGPFLVIIVTSFFSYAMLEVWGVKKVDVIGKVPQGFQVTMPANITLAEFQRLLPSSLILAVISYMLTFSVAKKYATANRYEIDPSQELVAMGVADFVGAFFGAFPVAGGFARTAVNVEAGAQSQLSSVVSAVLVAMAVNFLTNTFYHIPMCSLAAIVQVAICGVLDFSPYLKAWRMSKVEFSVMVITFVVTLILGIDKGIIAGVAISLVVLIRSATQPRVRVLARLPDTNVFRDCTRYPHGQLYPGIRILRVDESVNFASCASVKDQVLRAATTSSCDTDKEEEEGPPHTIVIECSGINHVDLSGIKMLEELRETLQRGNQTLYMANCKAKLRDRLKRAGLFQAFGGSLLYLSLPALLATLVEGEEEKAELMATNNLTANSANSGIAPVDAPILEEEEVFEIEWHI